MRKATIDLTDCKYLMELHERIRVGLNLQDGYGRNWSAFWDDINRNIKCDFITVKGSNTVADELKGSVEKMRERCYIDAIVMLVCEVYILWLFPLILKTFDSKLI